MSNQTKVTDFFVAAKKSENNKHFSNSLKNGNKLSTNDSLVTKSSPICGPIVLEKTPKRRKQVVNKEKSSKRKKTPAKSEIIIEFKSNNETNCETNTTQLNANEVKEKLKNCSKLSELRKQLLTINDCEEKLKQFKEIKVKSPIKRLTPIKHNRSPSKRSPIRSLVSPILSPNTLPAKTAHIKDNKCESNYRRRLFDVYEDKLSPNKDKDNKKDNNKDLLSFERWDHLVGPESDSLVLPPKYKVLAEAFRCTDTLVWMLYKRQEICTFDKLKQSVEGMMRKTFELKRLAQIQTVSGDCFKLKYESIGTHLANDNKSDNKYQLIITPTYNCNTSDVEMTAHLPKRYKSFKNKLLDITKEHQNCFLKQYGLSIDPTQLYQWHPMFKSQFDELPDIVPNDNALPIEPKYAQKSAEVFLETSRQRLGLSSSLTTDRTVVVDNDNDNQINVKTNSTEKITKGPLKGLSMDLLKKIRALEATNLAKQMTRRPETEKEIRILKSLPEIVRIIHSYFIGSKKITILYDDLINKIVDSYHCSLAILEARERVDYMIELLFPEWIFLLKVKNGSYVKIKKERALSSLDITINQRINHLKQ